MKKFWKFVGVLAATLSLVANSAVAQTAAEPLPSQEPAEGANVDIGRVIRIGAEATVRDGESAEEVVVILGSATIEGEVAGDVVVVLGDVVLTSTASVGGSVVVVAGQAKLEPGAAIEQDLVVVGGVLPAGDQVTIAEVSARFAAARPWLTSGLLWGRPIVPSLPWVWAIVAVLALVYLLVSVVFERPVRSCAQALSERPLSTGLTGVLVLVLLGPVSVLLCISVIGIGVVPFLWCAVFLAGLLGKVGVARWIGSGVVAEDSPSSRLQASRSLLIGLALICLAYVVPVLGIVTWAVFGVFGLGAASTAFVAGLRRENPAPPTPPAPGFASTPSPQPPNLAPEMGADESVDDAGKESPVEPAMATDLSAFPRASFFRRLGAVALDVLLVMISVAWLNLDGRAVALLLLAYHIVFWGWKSTTVGGIICQLRVTRIDGAPIRFPEALIRGLSSIFSVVVAGLGWFWILWDSNRQAWHDKIAGTLVVRVPGNLPLP